MDDGKMKLWKFTYTYMAWQSRGMLGSDTERGSAYPHWSYDKEERIVIAKALEQAVQLIVEELPTVPNRKMMDQDAAEELMKESKRPYPYLGVEVETLQQERKGVWAADGAGPQDVTALADKLIGLMPAKL